MVEETIQKSDKSAIPIPELKKNLPRKVNHNTLMVILEYLEKSGKIAIGLKGITWIYTDNATLQKLIKKGIEEKK
ncbi:MAG: hypothetical protein ACP5D2_03230 [Candidatus Nanoarchaeia archaeon]